MPSSYRLPFWNTAPLRDVGLLILLLPLWWILGIEQFIWMVALFWIGWKTLVIQDFKIYLPRSTRWLLLFLVVYGISGLFIVEGFRYLTFARNMGTYIALFWLLVIIPNQARRWDDIAYLLRCIMLTILVAGLIGLMGILGIWQPSFRSALGYVLPDWVTATDYGSRLAIRSTGGEGWFAYFGHYFRVSSVFLYPTLYASAIAITLPIILFLYGQTRHLGNKIFLVSVFFLLAANFIFTTGRFAMLGWMLGAVYFLSHSLRYRSLFFNLVLIGVGLLGIGLLVGLLLNEAELPETGKNIWLEVVNARGSGSPTSRWIIYQHTLSGFGQRPLFGWGTERDFGDFPYPAGSHSYYLGTLYKQGIIGLLVFLGMGWGLWRDTRPLGRSLAAPLSGIGHFLSYGRWIFVAVLADSIASIMDLDATTLALIGVLMASLIAARRLALAEGNAVQHN